MSFLRAEAQNTSLGKRLHYDLICELASDLTGASSAGYVEYNGSQLRPAPGSLCCCTGNGKIYSLGSDGTWTEVAG